MIHCTKFWFLEEFDLFKKLGKRTLTKMCEILEMEPIRKGEEIHFNREDKSVVFFLKSGTIKIVSADNHHTRHVVSKGNIFGEMQLIDDEPENEKAIVLEDGVVCFIEADRMKHLMEKFSSLKNQLLKWHGLRIKKLNRRLDDLLYKDSKTRIKEYVFSYIDEFGTENEKGKEAKNLLSHADIAFLTNTSRQTVNNVMSNLRKEGIIDYDTQKIQLLHKT